MALSKNEENMPILTKEDGEHNKRYEFTDDDIKIVEDMASLGLGIPDIAASLSVSEKYMYQVLKEEQKEAESFTGTGKYKTAYLDQNVWGRFQRGLKRHKMIISKGLTEHAIKGNPQVLMFLARSKLGWHDKPLLEDQNIADADALSDITVEFKSPLKLPESQLDEN